MYSYLGTSLIKSIAQDMCFCTDGKSSNIFNQQNINVAATAHQDFHDRNITPQLTKFPISNVWVNNIRKRFTKSRKAKGTVSIKSTQLSVSVDLQSRLMNNPEKIVIRE